MHDDTNYNMLFAILKMKKFPQKYMLTRALITIVITSWYYVVQLYSKIEKKFIKIKIFLCTLNFFNSNNKYEKKPHNSND